MLGNLTETVETPVSDTYDDVVFVHLTFGLLSVLGACAVYTVYAALPAGKLDPASRIIHMITIWDLLYSLKFTVSAGAPQRRITRQPGCSRILVTGHGCGVLRR